MTCVHKFVYIYIYILYFVFYQIIFLTDIIRMLTLNFVYLWKNVSMVYIITTQIYNTYMKNSQNILLFKITYNSHDNIYII